MTAAGENRIRGIERAALIVAAVALSFAFVFAWLAPEGVSSAWRLAVFLCLQPALGSLLFILIHKLTGGRWAEGLTPFLHAGARLLPWIWLLALPLLWLPHAAGQTHSHEGDSSLRMYFSMPMVAARAVFYAAAFFLVALGARKSLSSDSPGQMRWFGPAGLIGTVFLLHLLATDWLTRLEPGWYSTGFPLVWMVGQGIAGLALAISIAIGAGAKTAPAGANRRRGLDWGNLLLASLMAWSYLAFVHFLIIWSGNLSAEIGWYLRRSHGIWLVLLIALAVMEFGAPFPLLLSRAVKRSRPALAAVALIVLTGQFIHTVWLIMPAFPVPTPAAAGLHFVVVVAAAALFLNRYLAGARVASGRTAS